MVRIFQFGNMFEYKLLLKNDHSEMSFSLQIILSWESFRRGLR